MCLADRSWGAVWIPGPVFRGFLRPLLRRELFALGAGHVRAGPKLRRKVGSPELPSGHTFGSVLCFGKALLASGSLLQSRDEAVQQGNGVAVGSGPAHGTCTTHRLTSPPGDLPSLNSPVGRRVHGSWYLTIIDNSSINISVRWTFSCILGCYLRAELIGQKR